MAHRGMVYAANPDQQLLAVTDAKGFTILQLDSGQVEIGDTLSSDDEGKIWFNASRSIRLVAYPKERHVRPSELREHLFAKPGT